MSLWKLLCLGVFHTLCCSPANAACAQAVSNSKLEGPVSAVSNSKLAVRVVSEPNLEGPVRAVSNSKLAVSAVSEPKLEGPVRAVSEPTLGKVSRLKSEGSSLAKEVTLDKVDTRLYGDIWPRWFVHYKPLRNAPLIKGHIKPYPACSLKYAVETKELSVRGNSLFYKKQYGEKEKRQGPVNGIPGTGIVRDLLGQKRIAYVEYRPNNGERCDAALTGTNGIVPLMEGDTSAYTVEKVFYGQGKTEFNERYGMLSALQCLRFFNWSSVEAAESWYDKKVYIDRNLIEKGKSAITGIDRDRKKDGKRPIVEDGEEQQLESVKENREEQQRKKDGMGPIKEDGEEQQLESVKKNREEQQRDSWVTQKIHNTELLQNFPLLPEALKKPPEERPQYKKDKGEQIFFTGETIKEWVTKTWQLESPPPNPLPEFRVLLMGKSREFWLSGTYYVTKSEESNDMRTYFADFAVQEKVGGEMQDVVLTRLWRLFIRVAVVRHSGQMDCFIRVVAAYHDANKCFIKEEREKLLTSAKAFYDKFAKKWNFPRHNFLTHIPTRGGGSAKKGSVRPMGLPRAKSLPSLDRSPRMARARPQSPNSPGSDTMSLDRSPRVVGTMSLDRIPRVVGTMSLDRSPRVVGTMSLDRIPRVAGTMSQGPRSPGLDTKSLDRSPRLVKAMHQEHLAKGKKPGSLVGQSKGSDMALGSKVEARTPIRKETTV